MTAGPLLPCLAVPQPWATLLAYGLKTHRRMRRNTTHRGPLAVYAERGWRPEAYLALADEEFQAALRDCGYEPRFDPWCPHTPPGVGRWECPGLPLGAVVGVVELAAVHPVGGVWLHHPPSRQADRKARELMDEGGGGRLGDGRLPRWRPVSRRHGGWVWEFRRASPLAAPVPCRGAHGLFLAAVDPACRPPQDRPPPRVRLHRPGDRNRPPPPAPPKAVRQAARNRELDRPA